MDEQEIIYTNHRSYTAGECYDSGFRDGHDGIKFYPCTEWDMVEGDFVRGRRTEAAKRYADGYHAGRESWRDRFGAYPSTGSKHLDTPAQKETA